MIYDFVTRAIANVIGLYDPLRAARYLSQQNFFQKYQERGYLAAKKTGQDKGWRVSQSSGAQENVNAWQEVTNKARDLARNNPYIVGARRRHRANLICEGIWPRPKILQPTAKNKFDLDVNLNLEILRRWEIWAPRAGANGDSIYQLQRTAANHFFDDGQFLIRRIYKKKPARLELQLLECDHLDKSRDREASPGFNKIAGGIEIDQFNKPVKYYLTKYHPAEQMSEVQEVPADEIIHVFDRQRASDVIGICGYASVVQSVFRINEYAYSTMDTARLLNHFGVWIESPYVNDFGEVAQVSSTDQSITTKEPRHEIINPAGFHYGLPGEKPHLMAPGTTGSQYAPFMTRELQTMSVGAGVGYESVSNDGSQTNFAGSRALLIIERGYTKMNQAIFDEQFHSKIYQWFIEFEVYFNGLKMPNYEQDKSRYLRGKFNRPIQEWVDPQKDIAARGERIKLRLSTETDEAEDSGKDIEEIYATLAYEKSLREKLGINQTVDEINSTETTQVAEDQSEEGVGKWLK